MSDTPSQFEKHIIISSDEHLAVDLIAAETGLAKQQVKLVMKKGAVWVTRGKNTLRLRRAKKALKSGETVHVYYDRHVLELQPIEPELIMDVGQYSIWNKPYGMLSQGSKWGDHCTITRWAEQHLTPQRPSFVVHRLDRAANGLIIVAHEKKAAVALSALFEQRKVDKRYQIWVHGHFDEKASKQTPTRSDNDIDGRHAVSHFSFVQYDQNLDRSLLDVSIETGRKHQIRRHSADLGFPVVGDRLHGVAGDKEDLQLSAYYLSFICPYTHQQREYDLLKSE